MRRPFILRFALAAELAASGVLPAATLHAQSLPDPPAPQAAAAPAATSPAAAQLSSDPAPSGEPLTLEQAIARARANSPRLRGAAAANRQAEAAITTARAYANPSLEIYEGRQYARDVATPGIPGLLQHYAGYQPIEIPAERRARVQTANHLAASSRFAGQGLELSLVAEVKRAFYDCLRRRQEIGQARENLALVQDLYRRVEVEVKVGEKGRLELTRAEAELARARFDVRSAELQYATAIAALRVLIAAPPDAALTPAGDLEPRVVLPPETEQRAAVLRTHPALAQSEAEIEAAQSNLAREKAARIPQPTLFAEFENQPDQRYWRAGVTVPLPLFDRRRGQIESARASIERSTSMREQNRLALLGALERSREQYELADQQVTALEDGALRAAQNAVDAARSAYRFGERGIVELLDAQRVLQSVRGDLLDAQFARQSALVDLEELGALAPEARP